MQFNLRGPSLAETKILIVSFLYKNVPEFVVITLVGRVRVHQEIDFLQISNHQ